MKKFNKTLWVGIVNGSNQVINVVGTYGPSQDPVVRVERGVDAGKAFAIKWDSGGVIKELDLK